MEDNINDFTMLLYVCHTSIVESFNLSIFFLTRQWWASFDDQSNSSVVRYLRYRDVMRLDSLETRRKNSRARELYFSPVENSENAIEPSVQQ